MKRYVVLHNFDAVEEGELPVKKGEVVSSCEESSRDGWMMVMGGEGRERGFVPASYLREQIQTKGFDDRNESANDNQRMNLEETEQEVRADVKVVDSAVSTALPKSKNQMELIKLQRQREESMRYMIGRVDEAMIGIQKSRNETVALRDALDELENTVNRDHSQWKQLIDEEKSNLDRRTESRSVSR